MEKNGADRIQFMNNDQYKDKYKKLASEYNKGKSKSERKSAKELMQSGYDYERQGVTDSNKILKGLNLEDKYAGRDNIHENMVAVMQMTDKYDDSYIFDDKKKAALESKLDAKFNESDKEELKELFYSANGVDYNEMKNKENQKKAEQERARQAAAAQREQQEAARREQQEAARREQEEAVRRQQERMKAEKERAIQQSMAQGNKPTQQNMAKSMKEQQASAKKERDMQFKRWQAQKNNGGKNKK